MISPRPSGPSTMSHDPAVDATQQLACVLDRFGDALVAVDATAMLAVEGELGSALAAMSAVPQVGDRAAARAAAKQALTALLRCRRLGVSFSSIARLLDRAGRASDGYDRAGAYVERVPRSSALVTI